jgi:hypothetical protein
MVASIWIRYPLYAFLEICSGKRKSVPLHFVVLLVAPNAVVPIVCSS